MVGKKWVYYDPPRYTKSDLNLELYNGHADGLRKNKKGFYVLEAPGVGKVMELSRELRWHNNPHNPKSPNYEGNRERLARSYKLENLQLCGAGGKIVNEERPDKAKSGRGKQQRDPEHWDKLHKKMNPNRGDPQYEDEGRVLGSYSSKGHRPQKSKPWTSKKGPGKGWHGQIARHRMAALKGRRG